MPRLLPAGGDDEGGRELELMAGMAAGRGWQRRGGRTVSWFVLRPA